MKRWLVLALVTLAGCATSSDLAVRHAWAPSDDWWAQGVSAGGSLQRKDGTPVSLSPAEIRNLRSAFVLVSAASQVHAELAIADMDSLNAFAAEANGRRFIAFSVPMVHALGADRDALATIVGHELAHLQLNHGRLRKERNDSARGASHVIGTVLGQVIPFGGLLTSLGTSALTSAFSRDEEREADERGLEWARKAGFDPCGSARAIRLLAQKNGGPPIPFLASHPGHEERIKRAQRAAGHDC